MRLAISSCLALLSISAVAQDGESDASARDEIDREPQRCIRTNLIRRTKVIDDRTIAFFMRNRDVYINTLESRCPELAREQRFAYSSRVGQLCSSDVITVLRQFAGRLEPGFTCRLNEWVPVAAETVETMIAAAESRGATPAVTAEPVELPPEDESEAEQGETDE